MQRNDKSLQRQLLPRALSPGPETNHTKLALAPLHTDPWLASKNCKALLGRHTIMNIFIFSLENKVLFRAIKE